MNKGMLLQATSFRKTSGCLKAVDDVSLSLRSAIIIALVGPNGRGKTSTVTGHLAHLLRRFR